MPYTLFFHHAHRVLVRATYFWYFWNGEYFLIANLKMDLKYLYFGCTLLLLSILWFLLSELYEHIKQLCFTTHWISEKAPCPLQPQRKKKPHQIFGQAF